jgi:small subunit ribosomal protein S8
MNMQDPIANMLTIIRNMQTRLGKEVTIPYSNMKFSIANVLKNEGYIKDFSVIPDNSFKSILIYLKYYKGKAVIKHINRISSPGLRKYTSKDYLSNRSSKQGISIISTSKGIMSNIDAKKHNIGGEVICYVE